MSVAEGSASTAPLVVLYERDDAVAVPLLSQLRLAGYDVRAARTPVDLFDLLGKHQVALVLVDLGAATAGRREFWVALDAQRRGRTLQVMTFRQVGPARPFAPDEDPSARALADVEVAGPHDYARIIHGVRQRVPLPGMPAFGAPAGTGSPVPFPGGASQVGGSFAISPLPPGRPLAGPPGTEAYQQMPRAAALFPQTTAGISPYGQQAAVQSPAPYQPYQQPQSAAPAAPYAGPQPYAAPAPPYGSVYPQAPYGQQPSSPSYAPAPASVPGWEPSPFANPAGANPFSPAREVSPFAQPYAVNPFAGEAVPGGPAPFEPRQPVSHMAAPWSVPSGPGASAPASPPASTSYAPPSFGERSGLYAPPPNVPATSAPGPSQIGGGPSYAPSSPAAGVNISDTWIPPDEDAAVQTGVVPELAYRGNSHLASERAGMEWGAAPGHAEWDRPQGQYADVPAMTRNLPAVQSKTELALGTVLVDGALLTPSKLEVLKGIQSMLASVQMEYKLGELALLFRFLSPDQLLAALLVSRGLVTPQQIAGLGRVKQELAASGMDHDLESLLIMFHILTPEQLRRIRADLM